MVSQATSLKDALDQKMSELSEALDGLDEARAGQRPSDSEWCCKETLSHLLGEEGEDIVGMFRRFLDEETPLIGIVTGLPYYTPERQKMSLIELRDAVATRFGRLGDFLAGLTEEELTRKARVPLFKDTPFGEYPTLAQTAAAVINVHLPDHISQIRASR